jgi:quinol-cytochrome oxidoreductase complex cytochrome b subunit
MQYREVISAPIWLIAFVYFIFLSVVLSIWAALGDTPALLTFIALTIVLVVI